MNKQLFSMLSLGVFSVAIAGFGLPAEGGLFDFFRHHRGYSDCGPCGVVECAPACGHVVCAPVCGGYDYDDDDHGWCGHGGPVCAPAPVCAPPVCACPPPSCPPVCGHWRGDHDDDDDDDCDDDD